VTETSTSARSLQGTDLSPISQAQLDQVSLRLNQRPRKTLGFETPASSCKQVLRRPSEPTDPIGQVDLGFGSRGWVCHDKLRPDRGRMKCQLSKARKRVSGSINM